jgi:serine protease Do
MVRLSDGRVFVGKLVDRDERHDVAFLQIEPTALSPIEVRDPASLRTGELLLAIGHPADVTGACAVGILAERPGASDWLIRADIRLAPGYSGGPLCDAQGRIVGINSMIAGGFGVAISAAAVQRLIDHLRPRLGVTVEAVAVPEQQTSSFGLMVIELQPGAPAHLSGVIVGDVILGANGKRLNSAGQLSDVVAAGSHELRLELQRAGRRMQCEVVLIRERAVGVA